MMKLLLTKKYIVLISLLCIAFHGHAQSFSDSLTYESIVGTVLKNNPLIKQYEEKVNNSSLREALTRTAFYPNVYMSSNISRLFPIPAFDFTLPNPGTGEMISEHMQMVPDITMDYSLRINQMIYDFGKTEKNTALQQTITEISKLNVEQLKQRLALTAAGYFFNLVYLQKAIGIKTDEIATLTKHLAVIQKKQETGSATQYEILTTQVRISGSETQLTELQTAREVLLAHLNNLMGTSYPEFSVKDAFAPDNAEGTEDSIIDYALSHRSEMLLAEKNQSVAEWNYKITQSRNNPSLSFYGSTGFKNGYISEINALKFNYSAGLSLNIPLFDSYRKHIGKEIASSAIADTKYETESLKNKINDEVKENYVSLQLSGKKEEQYARQLELAQEAYNHAVTSYSTGSITNLDLLDAATRLSESRLLLLKAQVDYKFSVIKFDATLGENLY